MAVQRKIAMLRLFLDDMDPSEPSDEGWTMVGSLVKSQNKENSSLAENTIIWLLQKFAGNFIRMGPRTLWHGVQHAVRSFLYLTQEEMVWQRLNESGICNIDRKIGRSHAVAISRWMALQIAARYLLPIPMIACAILHVEGFDWIGEGPEPSPVMADKQIPLLFAKWTNTLRDCIERVEDFAALELETAVEKTGWAQTPLRGLNSKTLDPDQEQHGKKDILCCSTCNDDYTTLRAGLVGPRWIAFAECVKSDHRFSCTCSEFPRSRVNHRYDFRIQSNQSQGEDSKLNHNHFGDSQLAEGSAKDNQQNLKVEQKGCADDAERQAHGKQNHTDNLNDLHDSECVEDFEDENVNGEDNIEKDESCYGHTDWYIEEADTIISTMDDDKNTDYFKAAAHHLYRAQGRIWTGSYEPGELVCGSCLLKREEYLDEKGNGDDDIYSSMPTRFRKESS